MFVYKAVLAAVAVSAAWCADAVEQVGTIDWANRPERPAATREGYLPAASAESQGGDSAKIADWVKALDAIGDIHGFVLLRHGRLVAEGYWAPYERSFPHALNGVAGVMGAALLGAQQANGSPVEETGELLDALTAKDPARQLDEAFRLRELAAKRDVMYYEQAVSRRCMNYVGFTWEYAATPGDGAGRKTTVRNLARVGQLHLWKGDWFGKRLWTAAWADRYYRFFSRPSGMRAALGERGQILAVVPKSDLVLALTADTAETERILARTEALLLPAFGDAPRAENPSAAKGLAGLCASLHLPEVRDVATCAAETGTTYDLPTNRYGFTQFRLAKSEKGCNLELTRADSAQMLPLEPAPGRHRGHFTFADARKRPLDANGRHRIAATGGWQTPTRYRARVYLTEVADRFDYEIDLADPAAPVFTITRGCEPGAPVTLTGRPAATVGGVPRVQARAEILWTRPIRKAGYIGWPTVMRRRSGELVACYSGNREAHVCPYGRDELIRSFDGGETWTAQPEIFRNSLVDDRDCGIVELRNGDLLAAWFSSTCFAGSHPKAYAKLPKDLVDAARGMWTSRSTDGGRTWEPPVGHRGSAPHGAVQLKDGRILFAGHAWNRADVWNRKNHPEGDTCLMIEESTDDGRSWHVLSRIFPQAPFSAADDTSEPYLVETDDGRLIVFCRTANRPVMTQVESRDGGRTWSAMSETPIRGYPPHFLKTKSGKIVCSYVDRTTLHEMAVVSDDQGRTWDVANGIFLSKGPKVDMGYPSTVENEDGTLLSVYYQAEKADEPPCLMATKWRLLAACAAEGAAFSQAFSANDFRLTDCALREMKGLNGGQAVMLNADRGFVRNARGWAEAAFTAPTSGWYRVELRCAAKIRTPLEIWINDVDKVVLDCPASKLKKFAPQAFTHRFGAGRNVLRLLGPGSAYYVAVERMRVEGPVAEPPKPAARGPSAAEVAAKIDADFAGRTVTNAPNVTWLEPPKVAAPFRVAIDRVSPENTVVYYSGTVSPKRDDAAVEVTYRVTGADGSSALTKPVRVLVKGLGEARRTFVNPLGDGADPFVNRIDGWYYHIQAKHGKDRASLYLRRTRSFIDYGTAKPVRIHTFGPYSEKTHTSEVWGWFPIIRWTDGHYYVFYAASRRHDTASHRMFVLKSKTAGDPFSGYDELGMVDTGGVWAIGLNYFQWKGRFYAAWSGWRKQDRTHLPQCSYLAKMENPWTIGPRVEISAPTLPWEGLDAGTPIQEGAMVYEVDGKLVMLYCANASFSNRYAIGMLVYVGGDTEADLLNPANWVKRPEPFLSGTDAVLAPGVPGLTQSPDGREWWLLYHVAKYDGAGWCRQVMAQVVGTDGKGLPYIRKPASYYVPMYLPSGDGFVPPENTVLDASRAVLGGHAACLREPFSAYGRAVRLAENGDTATYRFEAAEEDLQEVVVRFACFAPESALGLSVNGGAVSAHDCRYLGPEDYYEFRTKVALKRGANELVLSHLRGGAVKVDLVVVGTAR